MNRYVISWELYSDTENVMEAAEKGFKALLQKKPSFVITDFNTADRWVVDMEKETIEELKYDE